MFISTRMIAIVVSGVLLAAAAGVALLAANGSHAQASSPGGCSCSRSTPIAGTDEVSAVPGQLQPRFGITHCQCGVATCVSLVAYGSVGVPQLFCVK